MTSQHPDEDPREGHGAPWCLGSLGTEERSETRSESGRHHSLCQLPEGETRGSRLLWGSGLKGLEQEVRCLQATVRERHQHTGSMPVTTVDRGGPRGEFPELADHNPSTGISRGIKCGTGRLVATVEARTWLG